MLGGKSTGSGDQQGDSQQEYPQEARKAPAAARRPAQDQSSAPRNFDNFDDDIPFANPYAGKWWSVQ